MMMINKHQSSILVTALAIIATTMLALSLVVDILFDDVEAKLKQKNVGSGEGTNSITEKVGIGVSEDNVQIDGPGIISGLSQSIEQSNVGSGGS
jgi:hypothetical protein